MNHRSIVPALLCSTLLGAGCSDASVALDGQEAALTTTLGTRGPRLAFERPGYDYSPSAMVDDDGAVKLWWCAAVAGDFIGYAEGPSLERLTPRPDAFFAPRNGGDERDPASSVTFDGHHACDPSVVKVDGRYYLYYGGLAATREAPYDSGPPLVLTDYPSAGAHATTYLGVATSTDGKHWTRLNGGEPIVAPHLSARDPRAFRASNPAGTYGAGQPSVVHVQGEFVMLYHDSTAPGRNIYNNAGVYALKSRDPLFRSGVAELRCPGDETPIPSGSCPNAEWRTLPPGEPPSGRYAVLDAFNAELVYADELAQFLVVTDGAPERTTVTRFTREFVRLESAEMPAGHWTEGPGVVRTPHGHLRNDTGFCGGATLDVIASYVTDPARSGEHAAWELGLWGADFLYDADCAGASYGDMYEGASIQTPGLPAMVVVGGRRVQIADAAVVSTLSRRVVPLTSDVYHRIPYGASIPRSAPVVGAPGRPAAFLLDGGALWPVDCLELITRNGSSIRMITTAEFDGHPIGGTLRCLR